MAVDGDDLTPVDAARTSYRDFTANHTDADNENLVDYLIRHKHNTPLEFAGATFRMVMPLFVARQLVRHRTASINEESLRYVGARPEFYIPSPEECRHQSETNKQGTSKAMGYRDANTAIAEITRSGVAAHDAYAYLVDLGLARELARTVLPTGQYTCWHWRANLRNIFQLLELRIDLHAQYQTRVYAEAMFDLLKPYFPNTFAAWTNHVLNAVTFSGDEMIALQQFIHDPNPDAFYRDSVLDICNNAKDNGMRPTRLKELEAKLCR